jgi:hypothetical protein
LEIVERHLLQGDEVLVLRCDAAMPACDFNPGHNLSTCYSCVGRGRAGLDLLARPVQTRPMIALTARDREELKALDVNVATLDALRALTVEQLDLGYGALSTMVSILREPEPDLTIHRDLVRRLLLASLAVYRSVQHHIDEFTPDIVYAWNGRFAPMRAAFRAAQSRSVTCTLHEVGSDLTRYARYVDSMPHDADYLTARIKETWDAAKVDEREAGGRAFFERRVVGTDPYADFVRGQRTGLLPDDWLPTRHNIGIFLSSEDEFVAIDDKFRQTIYENQEEGVRRIATDLLGRDDVRIYVRVHPNLGGLDNSQTRRVKGLSSPNLTVIPADSEVSTYMLLNSSSVVLTFGSTTGVEATYWGRPSVLAGPALYQHLDVTYGANSHEEVLTCLTAKLDPKPLERALMFGYYFYRFGEPYRFYVARERYRGEFKGSEIRSRNSVRKAAVAIAYRMGPVGPLISRTHARLKERRLTGR